jgi:hypothetical protein
MRNSQTVPLIDGGSEIACRWSDIARTFKRKTPECDLDQSGSADGFLTFHPPHSVFLQSRSTSMKRRAWTSRDIRMLKRLAGKKTRATNIAQSLRRTENATRQKAFSLGLSLETRAGRL